MFDVGFWELVLIGIVTLLVVGLERLSGLAQTSGLWLGRAPRLVDSVKADVEQELQLEEAKRLANQSRFSGLDHMMEDKAPKAPKRGHGSDHHGVKHKSGSKRTDRTDRGRSFAERLIFPDDMYKIREVASRWIVDHSINVVITNDGTGLTGRDGTSEAIKPLLEKMIQGAGELFRWPSYRDIKTSTLASRVLSGAANGTFIFCLPGATGACRTGWDEIIEPQLDNHNRPCNMVEPLPRMLEK